VGNEEVMEKIGTRRNDKIIHDQTEDYQSVLCKIIEPKSANPSLRVRIKYEKTPAGL